MTYQEFESEMQKRIQKTLGSKVTVTPQITAKNNHTFQHGFMIEEVPGNPETTVAPMVYLDDLYQAYLNGTSMEAIAKELCSAYRSAVENNKVSLKDFTHFDKSKGNIIYRLINRELNKEMLQNTPHIPYLDLAIVFYCIVEISQDTMGSFLIRNEHLTDWGVQLEDLQNYAQQNTAREFPCSFQSLHTVISEIVGCETPLFPEIPAPDLWVVTNHMRQYGAACILYDRVLEEIAEKLDEDYYVIPSSIHEVLIIRSSQTEDIDEISALIKDINVTTLSKADILSSHPYFYDRTSKTLTAA